MGRGEKRGAKPLFFDRMARNSIGGIPLQLCRQAVGIVGGSPQLGVAAAVAPVVSLRRRVVN